MTTKERTFEDIQPKEIDLKRQNPITRRTQELYSFLTKSILFGSFVAITYIAIGWLRFFATEKFGYTMNVYTEIASIVITIFVLDRLATKRNELLKTQTQQFLNNQLKQELITDLGGQSNDFAVRAVRMLANKGWLYDGSLKKANLRRAKLQGAELFDTHKQSTIRKRANLQYADLTDANLEDAILLDANLQESILWNANLQGANLLDANLQGAILEYADLEGADLLNANLKGAELEKANLKNVKNIQDAHFDEHTTLPDGTKWHDGVDLWKFVDGTWQVSRKR